MPTIVRRLLVAPAVTLVATSLVACADAPVAAPDAPQLAKASATGPAVSVVMSGLDSPRGLAWGPEGALYVAEAGSTSINGPCAPVARGLTCFSGTGALSRLWKGRQERVASGLPSVYLAAATDIAGPHDVSFQGRGNAYVTIGWGGSPAARAPLGAFGAALGHLIRVTPNGAWSVVADITGFESTNPDGSNVDSNPYGLLAEPGREYVTDAGGNSLVEVSADGDISLVATFPPFVLGPGPGNPPFTQSEAVPTEVQRGPDGALYVSTLSGVPFRSGVATIYRVVPGAAPTVFATGFKTITDFDITADGTLWVIQYATAPVFFGGPGALVRVAPDGTRSTIPVALQSPTGVLAGPDGAIYVSNKGNLADVGEVLRIVP